MTERLFGTDGIRAEAGQGPLAPGRVEELARCVVRVLRGRGIVGLDGRGGPVAAQPRVLLGRDPRRSGAEIAAALTAGLAAEGAQVVDGGVLTTPSVAWLTARGGYDLGVVVSASHNPARYNGIKLFSAGGYKVDDDSERAVEAEYLRGQAPHGGPAAAALAPANGAAAAAGDGGPAEAYMQEAVRQGPDLSGWRIAVDCAHGAAWRLAPEILRRLGADVVALGCQPDGLNINLGVGALHPEVVAARAVECGARLGLAFDGDADRVMFADAGGRVRDGDHVLALWGRHLAEQDALPGRVVVSTIMANLGLERALEEKGVRLVRTRVGDRWVVEGLLAEGGDLGGEQSGHIVHLSNSPTGDGILTALGVLRVLADTGADLAELSSCVVKCPQVLLNVGVAERVPVDQVPAFRDEVARVEAELGRAGRVVIRYSGTEPLLRIMLEGEDDTAIHRHARALVEAAERALPGAHARPS